MKKLLLLLSLILLFLIYAFWFHPGQDPGDYYVTSGLEDEDYFVVDPDIIQAVLPISSESSDFVAIPELVRKDLVDPTALGYTVYAMSQGITVYSMKGNFLLLIDLDRAGTRALHFATGEIFGPGIWDGDNAVFRSKTLSKYLNEGGSEAFACAFNGQFFKMVEYPTGLAAPLKANGKIVTYGWETKLHQGEKLMMEMSPGKARITPLDRSHFQSSPADDIVTGLTPEANKKPKHEVGRTFVATANGGSTLLVLVSPAATQRQMQKALESLGGEVIMMLDGGGSAQLSCRINGSEKTLLYSDRYIPQAVYVYSF